MMSSSATSARADRGAARRGRADPRGGARGAAGAQPRPAHFTLDLKDVLDSARIVFVCVGTPSSYSGDADLSAVWQVVDELADLDAHSCSS